MLFYVCRNAGMEQLDFVRGANSLGLFAGHPADAATVEIGGISHQFAELPSPRAAARRGWRPFRSPAGTVVLLVGWIDNTRDLASQLGAPANESAVYAAAVERWGDDADRYIVGEYASLTVTPDSVTRLARSPWSSFPLFLHRREGEFAVSSIPRPLFAAGAPRVLLGQAVERMAAFELPELSVSQFKDIDVVGGGTVVRLAADQLVRHAFYDPLAIPSVRYRKDEDYVEAATEKLAESARHALQRAVRPAVTLSGGLDSATVCDELWRQDRADGKLLALTFETLPEWSGRTIEPMFGNDRPYVEQFLTMHPGLDHRFIDNREVGFDRYLDSLMLAGDSAYPAGALAFVHHGVFAAAQRDGRDWLFNASMGNLHFSSEGPWAPAEFFRTGQWRQLLARVRANPGDRRSLPRRLIAMGILPNLPAGPQSWLRGLVHGSRDTIPVTNPYLSTEGRLAAKLRLAAAERNISDLDFMSSRERLIRNAYDMIWQGGEAGHALEQVFGLRTRDITGYRPLIELVLGMPTDQFVKDGERRRLARRMAIGRLPEAQRLEVRHGDHIPDWHERMTPKLDQLRKEIRQISNHPELSRLFDIDALQNDIAHWPAQAPLDMATATRLRVALPAVIMLRRFIDFESGRNPQ